ncbi:trypsin-like peptidase domain-containing protein [Schlesneria sp.]|uniref:trypsin-like peptidase domain-containing protein n=1 Tax=Schlesneria sp. TaxID=2762018 RepID=UPI002EE5ECA0
MMMRQEINVSNSPRSRLRSGLALILCVVISSTSLHAQDPAVALEDSIIKVVEQWERSVVSIARFKPAPFEAAAEDQRIFPLPRVQRELRDVDVRPNDFGAGCIVSPTESDERLVLTNFHVVRGGPVYPNVKAADKTELLVNFADRRSCRAAIIAADPRSDLAVLRLDWEGANINPEDFKSLNWELAPPPRKGQFVILLGNPYAIARDGSPSVSWGMVSNLTRQPISFGRQQLFDMEERAKVSMLYRLGAVMQLDARMNLGLSGGPVLNLKGELIGISTSLAAIEGYEQSVGFALPLDEHIRRIVRTLLDGQAVEYGMIGIVPGEINGNEFQRLNTDMPQQSAAIVVECAHSSPAELAGISVNDVILAVNGQPVLSRTDLFRLVGLYAPGTEIDVSIWREGTRPNRFDVKVKLGKWPVLDDEGIIETNPRHEPWRGITVDYPTGIDRLRDPMVDMRRVLVTRVDPDSPGDTARLQVGNFITHVNKTPVHTPAEFHAAVRNLSGPVTIRLDGDPRSIVPEIRKGRIVIVQDSPPTK